MYVYVMQVCSLEHVTTINVSFNSENISHGDADVEPNAAAFHIYNFGIIGGVGHSELIQTALV